MYILEKEAYLNAKLSWEVFQRSKCPVFDDRDFTEALDVVFDTRTKQSLSNN